MTASLGLVVALDRNSPPPPAWAVVGTLGILLAGFVGIGWAARSRRRREVPIRQEVAAAPITGYLPPVQVRLLFGQDYCFRARDTTIQMQGEWILIEDRSPMQVLPLLIRNTKMTRLIWDALVLAGAHPATPPPPSFP